MIQPLRTVHRRVLIVLAIVLPLLVAAGLIVRDRIPVATPSASAGSQP